MKYLKVFTDFAEEIELLSDVEVGRLFRAMLLYAKDGTATELNGNERFIWPNAKRNIDASAIAYKNLTANAKTARDSRSKANLRCSKARASYSYDGIALEQDKDKEKDKEKDKDKENNKLPPIIPPVDDILAQLPKEIRERPLNGLNTSGSVEMAINPRGYTHSLPKYPTQRRNSDQRR